MHLFDLPPHDRMAMRDAPPSASPLCTSTKCERQAHLGPRLQEARADRRGQGARERLARAQAGLEGRYAREERQHVADQEEAR